MRTLTREETAELARRATSPWREVSIYGLARTYGVTDRWVRGVRGGGPAGGGGPGGGRRWTSAPSDLRGGAGVHPAVRGGGAPPPRRARAGDRTVPRNPHTPQPHLAGAEGGGTGGGLPEEAETPGGGRVRATLRELPVADGLHGPAARRAPPRNPGRRLPARRRVRVHAPRDRGVRVGRLRPGGGDVRVPAPAPHGPRDPVHEGGVRGRRVLRPPPAGTRAGPRDPRAAHPRAGQTPSDGREGRAGERDDQGVPPAPLARRASGVPGPRRCPSLVQRAEAAHEPGLRARGDAPRGVRTEAASEGTGGLEASQMRTRSAWYRTRRFSKEVVLGYDSSRGECTDHHFQAARRHLCRGRPARTPRASDAPKEHDDADRRQRAAEGERERGENRHPAERGADCDGDLCIENLYPLCIRQEGVGPRHEVRWEVKGECEEAVKGRGGNAGIQPGNSAA